MKFSPGIWWIHHYLIIDFELPWISFRNNEVQFAGEIQPRGCCYCLEVHASDQKVILMKLNHV